MCLEGFPGPAAHVFAQFRRTAEEHQRIRKFRTPADAHGQPAPVPPEQPTDLAIGVAHQLGVDPRPFVVAVMFSASASFATPIGYQTNTFVFNAGGYRYLDFVKVGLPLNILNWLLASALIPLLWPF